MGENTRITLHMDASLDGFVAREEQGGARYRAQLRPGHDGA